MDTPTRSRRRLHRQLFFEAPASLVFLSLSCSLSLDLYSQPQSKTFRLQYKMCPPTLQSLARSLAPGSDLRALAASLPECPWPALWKLLPDDVESLSHAASATGSKGFKVRLAATASRIQILQSATHVTDTGHAVQTATGWEWPSAYVESTQAVRTELLAWHVFTMHAQELHQHWDITIPRAQGIFCTLFDRLGFHLQPAARDQPAIPTIHEQAFHKHVNERSLRPTR